MDRRIWLGKGNDDSHAGCIRSGRDKRRDTRCRKQHILMSMLCVVSRRRCQSLASFGTYRYEKCALLGFDWWDHHRSFSTSREVGHDCIRLALEQHGLFSSLQHGCSLCLRPSLLWTRPLWVLVICADFAIVVVALLVDLVLVVVVSLGVGLGDVLMKKAFVSAGCDPNRRGIHSARCNRWVVSPCYWCWPFVIVVEVVG